MKRVMKLTFTAIPKNDSILPPLSSKVVKFAIESGSFIPSLKPLVDSRAPNKPIFISNLSLGNKRLIKLGDTDEPIKVKAGDKLTFHISAPFYEKVLLELEDKTIGTPYGEFRFVFENMEVVEKGRAVKEDENFVIEFLSPTLFSSKVLLPPSLGDKYKKVNPGYSSLPSVGLIVAYGYSIYYSLMGSSDSKYVWRRFKLSVLANAFSKVVGYKLTPLTVNLGKDSKDRVRLARGFMGWLEFDIVNEKLKKLVSMILFYSNYLGMGKSRGVGLGEVKVYGKKP